jgi:fluoroquinolone resistance protein
MSDQLHLDIVFSQISILPAGDFEGCRFSRCDLGGLDLSGINFTDCVFDECNLSATKIIQTTFNDVRFTGCKILGLHFETANQHLLSVHFEKSTLDLCSFYQCKMKKTVFNQCSLQEVDFTETILTEANFDGCNLKGAKFERSHLEKADLRTAINYSMDPELNKLKQARFSSPEVLSLLDKYQLRISS